MKFVLFLSAILISSGLNQVPEKVNWGFYGHKKINRLAIFTLPSEMFGFYKEHVEYITEHAVDPDKRRYAMDGEAPCHYIDLDHFYHEGEDPYEVCPRNGMMR